MKCFELSSSQTRHSFIPTLIPGIQFNPLILALETSVEDAIHAMNHVRSSCALIVNPLSGEQPLARQPLAGILTERDVVQAIATGMNISVAVAELMTRSVITIQEAEAKDLLVVLQQFRHHNIRHLPVVNHQGQIVGLVTPSTIRNALKPIDLLKIRRVAEVMETRVIHAALTVSVTDIAQLMATHRVSCVVMVEPLLLAADEPAQPLLRPIGIITERDIVQLCSAAEQTDLLSLRQTAAAVIMSRPVFTIRPHDSLWNAHQLMQREVIRRLIVVGETEELIGIVTQTNILRVLDPLELHEIINALQQTVHNQQRQLHHETLQKHQLAASLAETEARYRVTESQLNMIFNSAIASIASLRVFPDRNWTYLYISAGSEAVFGYSPEEFAADEHLWASRIPREDLDTTIAERFEDIFAERDTSFEYRFRHKNGELHWISCTLTSQHEPDTNSWFVTTVAMDISDRKYIEAALRQSEKRLMESLQEKELFLREIHHRIKNNLQIVSSLLDLQAGRVNDLQLQDILISSQNRINSMALVHEALHHSQSLNQVDFSQYVQNLAHNLQRTYMDLRGQIVFKITIDPRLFISLNQAIPCGLILNELLTNSIKHGFSDGRNGEITVILTHQTTYHLMLSVSHNGRGLPSDFDMHTVSSMGLKLVMTLVKQLRGTLELKQDRNTHFVIEFPLIP